jgi:branched-chain amino acid transport system permease protein
VIGTELKLTVALVLIVGTLTLKPNGLFGKSSGDPRMKPIDRKWVWIGGVVTLLVPAGAALPGQELPGVPVQPGAGLCDRRAGLNILTGFNGQFSLGHGAFYAIGAYVPPS